MKKDMAFLLKKYGAKVGATDDFQADVLEVFETLKRKQMKTVTYKCVCETEPCYFVQKLDPKRKNRLPDFCPIDGRGCRWKLVDNSEIKSK